MSAPAPARRFTIAYRPGRAQCWYVVDLVTGQTVSRHASPDEARPAALAAALDAAYKEARGVRQ